MVNNRTDLELITSLVDKEARILDVGCGNGELLKSLKNKKRNVYNKDWKQLNLSLHGEKNSGHFKKPKKLEKMIL